MSVRARTYPFELSRGDVSCKRRLLEKQKASEKWVKQATVFRNSG